MVILEILIGTFISYGAPTSSNYDYDYYSGLGGFVTGIFSTMFILKPIVQNSYEKICKYIGLVVQSIYFILTFTLFFTIKKWDLSPS